MLGHRHRERTRVLIYQHVGTGKCDRAHLVDVDLGGLKVHWQLPFVDQRHRSMPQHVIEIGPLDLHLPGRAE
jgi:hypothetical protein